MKKTLFLALLTVALPAQAALHKWVDANGHVHYSDQAPPANAKAKVLRENASGETVPVGAITGATSAPAAAKTYAEKDAELKKANKEKLAAEAKAAEAQARKDAQQSACAAAQQNLRTLQEGMRMIEVDANGERTFVSDEQRQQRITKTQNDISTHCQ